MAQNSKYQPGQERLLSLDGNHSQCCPEIQEVYRTSSRTYQWEVQNWNTSELYVFEEKMKEKTLVKEH